jgi:hypothetical protein
VPDDPNSKLENDFPFKCPLWGTDGYVAIHVKRPGAWLPDLTIGRSGGVCKAVRSFSFSAEERAPGDDAEARDSERVKIAKPASIVGADLKIRNTC